MDMKVTLLGTSAGVPIPGRAQSGILVETPENKVLLDCGMGVPLRMAEAGVSCEEVDTVCLTHEHLDHIQDLPTLVKASWLRSREAKYTIVIPHGLKAPLITFCKAADRSIFEKRAVELNFEELKSKKMLRDNLTITAFDTLHTEISQGYKISFEGKEVVYTGDTEACGEVKNHSEGADLVIHELSFLKEKEGHTDPERLISLFEGSSIDDLVIHHFYPEAAERAEEIAEKIERETGIRTTAGKDLQTFMI